MSPTDAELCEAWTKAVSDTRGFAHYAFEARPGPRKDSAPALLDAVEAFLRRTLADVFDELPDYVPNPDGVFGVRDPHLACFLARIDLRVVALDEDEPTRTRRLAAIGLATTAVIGQVTGDDEILDRWRVECLKLADRGVEHLERCGLALTTIHDTREEVDEKHPHVLDTLRALRANAAFAPVAEALDLAIDGIAAADLAGFVRAARAAVTAAVAPANMIAPIAAPLPPITPSVPAPSDDEAMLHPAALARRFGLDQDAVEKRLSRWRRKHAATRDWTEVEGAGPREPRFLYRLGAVREVLARPLRPAKRPPNVPPEETERT